MNSKEFFGDAAEKGVVARRDFASYRWVAWLVLALSLSLNLLGWNSMVADLQSKAEERFELTIDEFHHAMNARLVGYTRAVNGMQAYVAANDRTPDLARLKENMRVAENYPGVAWIAYMQTPVREDGAQAAAGSRRAFAGDQLASLGEGMRTVAQTTVAPLGRGPEGWRPVEHRRILELARDSGENRISGNIALAAGDVRNPGFLMVQAVYRDGAVPHELAARRNSLVGFLSVGIRADTLLFGLLGEKPKEIAVRLHDGPDVRAALFHQSHPGNDFSAARFHQARHLNVGGRVWTVDYASLPDFETKVASRQPVRFLVAGVLVSLLLFTVVWSLSRTRIQAIDVARRMTASLRSSEAKLRELFVQAPLGVMTIDASGRVTDCNEKLLRYAGAKREQVLGADMLKQGNADLMEPLRNAIGGATTTVETDRTPVTGEAGDHFRCHFQPIKLDGELINVLCFVEDISERKRAEAHIEHLAHHDALTGLTNRHRFGECLDLAIASAAQANRSVGLLFLDLDDFKTVNDTLGHSVGDALLVKIAQRLGQCVRQSDQIARIGGDEFLILLNNLSEPKACARVAEKIIAAVSQPLELGERHFSITVSIGIAVWPTDGDNAEALSRSADLAMYHAKNRGRNNYQFFTAELNAKAFDALATEAALRKALDRQEFVLHYQAQVDVANRRITGAEALVRWQHPELGMLGPDKFIPVAEERGLINRIGEWVLHDACRQAKAWQDAGLPPLPVAVNISARQLREGTLRDSVLAALAASGLDPRLLVLEITETAVMEDMDTAVAVLEELGRLGVAIEIDDFGTGYSSLTYLKRLPIHRLKIDRSFVRDVPGTGDDEAIIRAIVSMAHSLKLEVIAEGVETADQAGFLRDLGCPDMQGYWLARPEPPLEFERLVARGNIVPPDHS
jgi:diguanylate cyclase (GGDEF)-like protein/PAS domain S-box-containing protein